MKLPSGVRALLAEFPGAELRPKVAPLPPDGCDAEVVAEYLRRGNAAAGRLVAVAQAAAALGAPPVVGGLWGPAGAAMPGGAAAVGRPPTPRAPHELASALHAFVEAAQALIPFVAATPQYKAALEPGLVAMVIAESGGSVGATAAAQLCARLEALGAEPEAVRDLRSSYAIALEVARSPESRELVTNRSAAMALAQLGARFPEISRLIQAHVDEFGWIRTHDRRFEPSSAKDLLQRLQMILLRWQPESIAYAAAPRPIAPGDVLGFAPSPSLAARIAALAQLVSGRAFTGAAYHQADAIAAPFWAALAQALGCPPQQLQRASAGEIADALTGAAALPLADLEARGGPASGEAVVAPVSGQAVSLGRAVGRVRIMYGPLEVPALEMGDVLVTAASTPDKMGTESTFPHREGAPAGMERVAAIVADEGGLLSHAATISRELGIPCVVGTERGTRQLKDGQMVEVDATREMGRVIVLDAS
ncbi:MAG: hypothetical protein NVSMB32_02290 [Actinomycetota bacterium]